MKLLTGLDSTELDRIKRVTGEAFVTNELFHELGTVNERRELVMRYMAAFVDYAYESGALYSTDDGLGFIGLMDSRRQPVMPQLKMLCRIFAALPFAKLKKLLGYVGQISGGSKAYAKTPHLEVLMVAVEKSAQGKGLARELFAYAANKAEKEGLPLTVGTDMKDYADMYMHFGCELYSSMTADNGITRYDLVLHQGCYAE